MSRRRETAGRKQAERASFVLALATVVREVLTIFPIFYLFLAYDLVLAFPRWLLFSCYVLLVLSHSFSELFL